MDKTYLSPAVLRTGKQATGPYLTDRRCVMCDREFHLTTSLRHLCCSGRDCGCGGERLALDVCSATCHETKYSSAVCQHGCPEQNECDECAREEGEGLYLETHPPGSACTPGCGHCGRCT